MNVFLHFSGRAAGRRLQQEHQKMFPGYLSGAPANTAEWQAAAGNGATIGWALRAADTTAKEATSSRPWCAVYSVGCALHLASGIPISAIDRLLADGWSVVKLYELMAQMTRSSLSKRARRLAALHEAAPETCGSDGGLLWHAGAAVMCADSAGLTDMQALRWSQLLTPKPEPTPRYIEYDFIPQLWEWVDVAGPEGWAWLAAGYTFAETQVLCAFPDGHPARPGPDQLAVMAALREK